MATDINQSANWSVGENTLITDRAVPHTTVYIEGSDRLEGGAGTDILVGNGEDDELYGGNGDDELAGGLGDDLLVGGAGSDTFIFGLSHGSDTIFTSDGFMFPPPTQEPLDPSFKAEGSSDLDLIALITFSLAKWDDFADVREQGVFEIFEPGLYDCG